MMSMQPRDCSGDIVWASMVVHSAIRWPRSAASGASCGRGGTLVVVEFGGHSRVLPAREIQSLPAERWGRLQDAARATLVERLGLDLIDRDWPRDLRLAGLTDVDDAVVAFTHDGALDELGRRWLVRNIRGGLGMAGDALAPADVGGARRVRNRPRAGRSP